MATRPIISTPPAIAVVVSRYNRTITDQLLVGAAEVYKKQGGRVSDLSIITAPGAFETVALSYAAADTGVYAGVLALGCIIKGETKHDEYLGHAVTQGLVNVSLITGVPVGLGVLTVNSVKQAKARAGLAKKKKGKSVSNKGSEAMSALLMTIEEMARLGTPAKNVGAPSKRGIVELDASILARPAKAGRGGGSGGGAE